MKILVVVDMQNDFIDGSLGTKEAKSILPFVKDKIEVFQKNKDQVIYTKDTHYENYLETQEGLKLPVKHCIKNTSGWEIPSSILLPNAKVFEKETFGSVHLIEYLKTQEFDELHFVGLCTDICVVSNVLLAKATFSNKKIVVDSKCCAGVTPKSHEEALNTMRMCQIDIL